MAEQLIESLSAEFEPDKFHDEYRERVLEMIERKAAGEQIAVQPEVEEPAAAPDLMAALEASLAAVQTDGKAEKESASARRQASRAGSRSRDSSGSRGRTKAKR